MRYLIVFFSIALFAGCGFFDNSDLEVSYIHFKNPKVITTGGQGSNVHNIKDLWFEMDSDDLGVFPVDRTVPFLPQNNPAKLFVFPGIKNNGIQTNGVIYPFYDWIEMDINFEPNALDTMTLEFEYKEEAKFSFVEGFEGALLFSQDEDEDEDSGMTIETIDGNKVGVLNPTEEFDQIGVSNAINYTDIPLTQQPVYLELEYKNNVHFSVGIIGQLSSTQDFTNVKIILNPKEEWNKIYIDFTEEVRLSELDAYRIVFATVYDESVSEEQKVYIDNVKLVHY